jgi:hypothetical protein
MDPMRVFARLLRACRLVLLTLLVGAASAEVLPEPSAAASTGGLTCDGVLHQIKTPTAALPDLSGVGGSAADDVWVVGAALDFEDGGPVLWHWNGSSWSVHDAGPNTRYGQLNGVETFSTVNAWAVGWQLGSNLIERWNGHSWHRVPTGLPERGVGLDDIDASGPHSMWAVGSKGGNSFTSTKRSYVVHSDGREWHVVPQPFSLANRAALLGVAAVGRGDVWAVGGGDLKGKTWGEAPRAVVQHWDGHRWQLSPSPQPGSAINVLQSVAARAPDDVWAVGTEGDSDGTRALIEHFDGKGWRQVRAPTLSDPYVDLFSVVTSPSTGTWAFGSRAGNGGAPHLLVERLRAGRWSAVPMKRRWGSFYGAWAGDRAVWAVGETARRQRVVSLVERACFS